MDIDGNQKRGYLNQDFRLFHLKDQRKQEFSPHYHDFDKIIIFLSGNVTYLVEGKAYPLKPLDILLINHHAIHKPIIDASIPYERIIIWINSDFMEEHSRSAYNLSTCFHLADQRSINMIRMESPFQTKIRTLLYDLEQALSEHEFASPLLANSIFLQFIIHLNRILIEDRNTITEASYRGNQHILELLRYINTHLDQDLDIDTLSETFFLSRSYLMHRFKSETGYTIHAYIQQKRLLFAGELIRNQIPVTEACYQAGFSDYSTFSRAYKKMYGVSPRTSLKETETF